MTDRLWILVALVTFVFTGCSHNRIEKYLQTHHDLTPDVILALSSSKIINGMTAEEVKLLLGEPMVIESVSASLERWIYRGASIGVKQKDAYEPDSAFPQGIGAVVPLPYRAQEIQVDLEAGKVCRVEDIISF